MQRSGSVGSDLKLKSENQGIKATELMPEYRGSEKFYTSGDVSMTNTSILCRTFIFLMKSSILIFEYEHVRVCVCVCDAKSLASYTLCTFFPAASPFHRSQMSNNFVVRGTNG